MQGKASQSAFGRFYLWMFEAKFTMGIFFMFYVVLYLLLGLVSAEPAVALGLSDAFQMILLAFLIGIAQQALLPDGGRLTSARGALFVAIGTAATLVCSLAFSWFRGFPVWCPIVFVALTAVAIALMIYSLHLRLMRETERLNSQLDAFKHRA